jgi:hypothetical protein
MRGDAISFSREACPGKFLSNKTNRTAEAEIECITQSFNPKF